MTSYAFYSFGDGGVAVCLEFAELASDLEARRQARSLLIEHPTCVQIDVWEGDRFVDVVSRDMAEPMRRAL